MAETNVEMVYLHRGQVPETSIQCSRHWTQKLWLQPQRVTKHGPKMPRQMAQLVSRFSGSNSRGWRSPDDLELASVWLGWTADESLLNRGLLNREKIEWATDSNPLGTMCSCILILNNMYVWAVLDQLFRPWRPRWSKLEVTMLQLKSSKSSALND